MLKGLFDRISSGNTLYYPGCLTKFVLPRVDENYRKILKAMGISYILLKDKEFCCGSPVLNAGYKKDFDDLVRKNTETFRQFGVGRIVTNCPACFYMIKNHYSVPVEHMTTLIWKNIRRFESGRFAGERITYHDPCHLGRHSGIYDEPRNILKHLGFEVVEFPQNRNLSLCCGGGGGLKTNCPSMSNDIAKSRFAELKTKKLITPCPMCYAQFKENAPKGVEVLEFSEVLV
jgi:Fe-S oxidoreductase